MITVYAVQMALIFSKDTCKLTFGHIIEESTLLNWGSCLSFPFGFFGWFIATIEVFDDIYTLVNFWQDMNYIKAAYYVGKTPINASFYILEIVFSAILSVKSAKLETK